MTMLPMYLDRATHLPPSFVSPGPRVHRKSHRAYVAKIDALRPHIQILALGKDTVDTAAAAAVLAIEISQLWIDLPLSLDYWAVLSIADRTTDCTILHGVKIGFVDELFWLVGLAKPYAPPPLRLFKADPSQLLYCYSHPPSSAVLQLACCGAVGNDAWVAGFRSPYPEVTEVTEDGHFVVNCCRYIART